MVTATDGDYTDDVIACARMVPGFIENVKAAFEKMDISDNKEIRLRNGLLRAFITTGALGHPLVARVFARAMIDDVDWKKVLESITETERT